MKMKVIRNGDVIHTALSLMKSSTSGFMMGEGEIPFLNEISRRARLLFRRVRRPEIIPLRRPEIIPLRRPKNNS